MGKRESILILGLGGTGKSFISNGIMEACGSKKRFKSTSSVLPVTEDPQFEDLSFSGTRFRLCDFPGVCESKEKDGINTCKLVEMMQELPVKAIFFVYNGRFSEPSQIWFLRMREIAPKISALIIQNLCSDMSPEITAESRIEIRQILKQMGVRAEIPFWRLKTFRCDESPVQDISKLLDQAIPFVGVKVSHPKIPDICYKEKIHGEEYKEVISDIVKDEGYYETVTRTEHYTTQELRRVDPPIFGSLLRTILFPTFSEVVAVPHTRIVEERLWRSRVVRYREIATKRDTFKLRYDGKRDFLETKIIRTRTKIS